MKSSKTAKVKYGKKDIVPIDALDPKNHKVRITSFIDGDILVELKQRALQEGTKYQTLMNQLLRQSLKDTESLAERLKKLEAVVFRKTAG